MLRTSTTYSPLAQADNDGPDSDAPVVDGAQSASGQRWANRSRETAQVAPNGRSPVYYGDGPFEAPSSASEDEEEVEEKPVRVQKESAGMRVLHGLGYHHDDLGSDDLESPLNAGLIVGQRRNSPLRYLLAALLGLCLLAAIIGILAARSYRGTSFKTKGAKHITMDHIFNGTFRADSAELHWVAEAGDGVYSTTDGFNLNLVDLSTNTTKRLMKLTDLKDEHGNLLRISSWRLSADMKYVLLATDWTKQWRWSGWANYYVYTIADGTTRPIVAPSNPPTVSYTSWAPVGNALAFVSSNDLYVLPDAESTVPIRVTSTGNHSFFNGITDWVYEEEVFNGPGALWWSPDGTRIAYLVTNDDGVRDFEYTVFNSAWNSNNVQAYPDTMRMPYPKPGTPNPVVSVQIFHLSLYQGAHPEPPTADAVDPVFVKELSWPEQREKEESIIHEVAWVGNAELMVKETNRGADDGAVVYFDLRGLGAPVSRVARKLGKNGEQGDDGWIEPGQNIFWLRNRVARAAYLDVLPNPDGYLHVALFDPADSGTPQWLTTGKWEVVNGIATVDEARGLVYFMAAHPSPAEKHLYSIPIPAPGVAPVPTEPKPITDTSAPSYYGAAFSPGAGFYVLSYQGPGVPWQSVYKVDNSSFVHPLTDNKRLNETLSTFNLPTINYMTIESDGYELSALEIRPPGMDDTGHTKYPVLFRVYGGPTFNLVSYRYSPDWHWYLACASQLKYIVVAVDGRGTMYRGRKLRNPVRGNLGHYEGIDQANAARIWAAKRYVDPRRIGIWGWSYGGYQTLKVVEQAAGLHSLAMSVAPVVDWRFYDSIYTERYMNTLPLNPEGYDNAAIRNVSNFANVNFLLAHGSGDDNVHFANAAHLVDMLTEQKVRNYRFRMFTDSDHSIVTRGANRELYEWMTDFLREKWGKGGSRRGW
ncbi:hypothetical protein AURDEDRAFT_113055 [Auricularia subglabra TFB-10046 SS5]|nr:hypothetical protein AURDEDRAFT_113055 [Auricularia subglabra TFB-10046 SS5]